MILWAEPSHYLIAFLVYFFTGCIGMSMGYHRLWSHKSWQAPRWFQIFSALCGSLGLTGSPLAWVAVHREHHRSTDLSHDPHSPLHQSFFRVQFLTMFHKPNLMLIKDLVQVDYLRFFHRYYLLVNLTYAGALVAIDPFAPVYAYLFPAAVLWNAGSLINNLGHQWGYRRFNTADHSRNNVLLGIFMWGEGWHNNHHRYPGRARFGVKPFEIDVSHFLIRKLEIKRGPPSRAS